jgi:folate-binding protein YgfZ
VQTGAATGVEDGGQLRAFGDDACWIKVKEITPNDRVIFASIPPATASVWLTGALPVGWEAFDRARIDAGRAWMGLDVDSERLVPEPGWEDHISYSKGCYLGQETLARLHYQGRLNWRLSRLSWSGPPVPSGSELVSGETTEGKGRLGWITSVQPVDGGCHALGFLHRRVEEESIALSLPDGRSVTPLPST